MTPNLDDAMRARAQTLGAHNVPRSIWFDPPGVMVYRCRTDFPVPDCHGCSETRHPPSGATVWRFTPPAG